MEANTPQYYGADGKPLPKEECALMEDVRAMDKLLSKADAQEQNTDIILDKLDEILSHVKEDETVFSATGPEFEEIPEPEDLEMWIPGYKLIDGDEFHSEEEALFTDEEMARIFAINRYQDVENGGLKIAYTRKVRVNFNR